MQEKSDTRLMERIDNVQELYTDLMGLLVESVAEETVRRDPALLDDQIESIMVNIEDCMRDLREGRLDLSA